MKKSILGVVGLLFLFLGSTHMSAQANDAEKIKIKKHTVMELYEPDLVLSVDARMQLKVEHKNTMARRNSILDTLDISERRRQRLRKLLLKNPFSDQLNKAMAEIEFEDDIMDN
ncbi:MAG: hypothetical protein WBM98_16970 [Maribacter sp.]|uniref:hypothetical protein n=1 Tax=Maribacter sp. TaxID=1897614 RepID=UPI003C745D2F